LFSILVSHVTPKSAHREAAVLLPSAFANDCHLTDYVVRTDRY
jgi:hypothetical protein